MVDINIQIVMFQITVVVNPIFHLFLQVWTLVPKGYFCRFTQNIKYMKRVKDNYKTLLL